MADNRVEFHYSAEDVASAQRLRFFRSKQIKVLAALWIASTIFLLLSLEFFPAMSMLNRPLVLGVTLAYVVGIFLLVLLSPYITFVFNRFWRLPLQFQFNEKQVRLSVVKGKSKGLQLAWNEITQVQENPRVIILHYGEGKKFIILPKSAFGSGQDGVPSAAERRFREILRRRGPQAAGAPPIQPAQKPAPVEPAAEEEETGE